MNKRLHRILIVDDEELNRVVFKDMVESLGHIAEVASDGVGALAMSKLDIDLVLMDVNMPGMDGFEVVRRIREHPETQDLPIIMVTALSEKEDRLRAVNAGANDFIAKPVDLTELQVRSASLLKIKEHQDELRRYQAELEALVDKRTEALRNTLDEMAEAQRQTYDAQLETIHRLAVAAEYKDSNTAAHINRVSYYCALLGKAMNLSPGDTEILKHASPMHDVGKIGIPEEILLKPGKLDAEEWKIMRQHTTFGARILGDSESELLKAGEVIAISHHEQWDGNGYPDGLKGEDIPVMGRICAVADVFDAITTKRPYNEAMPNENAIELIKEKKGNHMDPHIVDLFMENLEDIYEIQSRYQDLSESDIVTA